MANSKRRCGRCKEYFPTKDLARSGPFNACCGPCSQLPAPRKDSPAPKARRSTMKRSKAPTTPPALKREVRERDGHVCRFCGRQRLLMECHHIYYRSQGGPDVAHNLILLCEEHHALVHSKKKVWQPVLLAVIWKHYVEGQVVSVPAMKAALDLVADDTQE